MIYRFINLYMVNYFSTRVPTPFNEKTITVSIKMTKTTGYPFAKE